MSQNNYKIKIVKFLLQEKNHIRGLAKELFTNQTTIARKMQKLYDENVVDFVKEGKNKVFSLKKTLEAKQYACMSDLYSLFELLKKYPALRRIVEQIRKNQEKCVPRRN